MNISAKWLLINLLRKKVIDIAQNVYRFMFCQKFCRPGRLIDIFHWFWYAGLNEQYYGDNHLNAEILQKQKSAIYPFAAPRGLKNNHLQTVLPRLLRKKPLFRPHWQRLETPDGDFLDLSWSEDPTSRPALAKPIFIMFHGLEGSFYSPYANGLLYAFAQKGWLSVLMHFRGCSGTVNRLARAYHSGETEDARFFLSTVHQQFPDTPKAVIGFSLGGNMLSRYLAKYAKEPLVDMAAIVSAPFDLASCARRMEEGLSLVYNKFLLGSLKRTALAKVSLLQQEIAVSEESIKQLKTLSEFDDLITAPLHGFDDAADYYHTCSGLPVLSDIQIDTLIIQAADDPFMGESVFIQHKLPDNIDYRLYDNGGHVGFLSGSFTRPEFWLEKTLPRYFERLLIEADFF